MVNFQIWYRIGIMAEKDLFSDLKATYDGVVVSAHIASFYKLAMTTFLPSLGRPFIVDPMTYAFARDLQNIKRGNDFRKSFQKLIDWYGGKVKTILEKRQLLPSDFLKGKTWIKDTVDTIVKRTVALQLDLLKPGGPVQQSLSEYLEIIKETKPQIKKPLFIVAPYFYFPSVSDVWYSINLQVAKRAAKATKEDVFAVICASKETLLDEKDVRKIATDFRRFKGVLLWISDFDDEKDSTEYLAGLVQLVHLLDKNKKLIYFLYGGSFIPLLSKKFSYLRGYSRGICYGDSKDVDTEMPTGGGAPVRYYMDLTKTKLLEGIARVFYSDNPGMLCACQICTSISKGVRSRKGTAAYAAEFFDRMNYTLTRLHFAHSHTSEIESISKMPLQDILRKLAKNTRTANSLNLNFKYGIQFSHLERWKDAISK